MIRARVLIGPISTGHSAWQSQRLVAVIALAPASATTIAAVRGFHGGQRLRRSSLLIPAQIREVADLPRRLADALTFYTVDFAELMSVVVAAGDHSLEVVAEARITHDLADAIVIIVMPIVEFSQVVGIVGRSVVGVVLVVVVPTRQAIDVVDVVVAAVVTDVEREQRIVPIPVPVSVLIEGVPGGDPQTEVIAAVVIAKVVVAVTGADEQVQRERSGCDRKPGREEPVRTIPPIQIPEADRREQSAAERQPVVPVPGPVDIAVGSPDVAVRDPHVIVVRRGPVTSLPLVTAVVDPAAWDPKMIVGGRRDIRPLLKAGRRLREVIEFGCVIGGPEP